MWVVKKVREPFEVHAPLPWDRWLRMISLIYPPGFGVRLSPAAFRWANEPNYGLVREMFGTLCRVLGLQIWISSRPLRISQSIHSGA
jgi:hypothetical protein